MKIVTGQGARASSRIRALILLFATLTLAPTTSCIAELECASGDFTCDEGGMVALLAGLRPPTFAVGTNTGQVAYSSDGGFTWQSTTLPDPAATISGFISADGLIYAYGRDSGATSAFFISKDFETWSGPHLIPGSSGITAGGTDGLRILVVDNAGQIYEIFRDGTNTPGVIPGSGGIFYLTWVSGFWFYSDNGGNSLFYSSDGNSWNTPSVPPVDRMADLVFVGDRYWGPNDVDGYAGASEPGNWVTDPTGNVSTGACSSNGLAVAVRTLGRYDVTFNGNGLDGSGTTSISSDLDDVACDGSTFIAVPGISGDFTVSRSMALDGSWETIPNPIGAAVPQGIDLLR
ncbi:MAG: hypothetical protein RH862_03615 [Leptospiraceae bacterium]